MPDASDARRKRALLIGINTYPNLSKFSQLDGCVNDVQLMARVLQDQFGFPEEKVVVLTEEAATRAGILQALKDLAAQVQRDDIVVVQYAGHGSQIRDREGDEPDGWDETIMPYDATRDREAANCDITDDEIFAWLQRVTEKTPYVTLVFDCCHSGTLARDGFGVKARWVEPDRRPVDALPPSPVPVGSLRGAEGDAGPSGWLPLGSRYVLIAGCHDEESSYEYRDPEGDVAHGAMTFFLCRELVRARPGTTYRDVYERLAPSVTTNSSRQHPQIEGAQDRELFGVRDIEPMRFAPITERTGGAAVLAAGAAHGVSVGSEWGIYPPGTKQTTERGGRLGRVKITAVRAVTSDAVVVEEATEGAISSHTRAVEEVHSYETLYLRVRIEVPEDDAREGEALAAILDAPDLLQIVGAGATAAVCAYLILPREAVAAADPAPQLGPLDRPVWAVVGQDGTLVMPVKDAAQGGALTDIRDNLIKLAKYRQALDLVNPDPASRLQGQIDFVLLREHPDGTWAEAEPEAAGGQVVYVHGERLAFRFTNNHTEPVYLNLLDFGLLGGIDRIYPYGRATEALQPGASVTFGIREKITLTMPDDYPFARDPADPDATEGVETFKLFATSQEADLTPLLQERFRGGRGSPLERLLAVALQGRGTRELVVEVEPQEDWTTVSRSFTLCRSPRSSREDESSHRVQVHRGDGGGAPPVEDDDVQFTVYRPGTVQPEAWYSLLAFAHGADRLEEVQHRVEQALGAEAVTYQALTQDSRAAVPRGGVLRFVPMIDGVTFNPSSRTIAWWEDVHQETFRFRASKDLEGTTVRGHMAIYLEHILLAEVTLRLQVSSEADPDRARPSPVAEHARPYRKIFVSYSHKDLDVVKHIERFATLTGDEYVRDWTHLRAGQDWSAELLRMIDDADIVQLFWSSHAMQSPYVKQEWEYALALNRPHFVRPVYWEDPFPAQPDAQLPPPELARLHFQKIDLGK